MNKKCERCLKIVYPLEELKCFDKVWHKSCFRCTECGMPLTLKNYRGYNKMPYCNAHTPKLRATSITPTPEMKRSTNSAQPQSDNKNLENVKRENESSTKASSMTETVRSKHSTRIHSNVAYRICKFEHQNIVEQRKRELGALLENNTLNRAGLNGAASNSKRTSLINLYQAKARAVTALTSSDSCNSSYSNFSESSACSFKFTTPPPKPTILSKSPRTSKNTLNDKVPPKGSATSMPKEGTKLERLDAGNTAENIQQLFVRHKENPSVSSLSMELQGHDNAPEGDYLQDLSVVPSGSNVTLTGLNPSVPSKSKRKGEYKKLEKITDLKDLESIVKNDEKVNAENENQNENETEPSASSGSCGSSERKASSLNAHVYRAAYSFEAKDIDEVSFLEGDIIYQVERENSGWITGRVERTGRVGILPTTHVERLKYDFQGQTDPKPKQIQGNQTYVVAEAVDIKEIENETNVVPEALDLKNIENETSLVAESLNLKD